MHVETIYKEKKLDQFGNGAKLGRKTGVPITSGCYFVELASGLRHWFYTLEDAEKSQYWVTY